MALELLSLLFTFKNSLNVRNYLRFRFFFRLAKRFTREHFIRSCSLADGNNIFLVQKSY